MSTTQVNYPEAFRFGARFIGAWILTFLVAWFIIWTFSGHNDKIARGVWVLGTISITIGACFLIGHFNRTSSLAGRVDASTLSNRHTRTVDIPGPPEDALEMTEATLRSQRLLGGLDIDRKALTITARIRAVDRSGFDGGSGDSANLVRVTLEPGEGMTRTQWRFEPESGQWRDWLILDYGGNLENALAIIAILEERIAERRRAERQAAERNALEKQLAEAQLSLLQAQVEPHFLYNTLANAQLLTRSDPARADKMLGHLIEFLRSSLPGASMEQSTLGVEVERSRAYLEILRIRMGERLRVEVEVADSLRNVALPPLMLQTLVENAIKHGLEPKPGGGTLWIRAEMAGDMARISVADDGVGFQEGTAGTGLGLKNVRDRLKLVFGGAATLNLVSNFPSGVTATMTVPVSTKD